MEEGMSILNQLASAQNRKDEVPNQQLAKAIAISGNERAINELAEHLTDKRKAIQNDCIKVLYEVGELSPELIMAHLNRFMELLRHKNNRLQWGAMAALNCIATIRSKAIYERLPQIMDAADKGSVITRDHAVNILIKLMVVQKYADNAFHLLLEQLHKCPTNQLPMYAERALPVVTTTQQEKFINALKGRLGEIEKESKRKRVEKVVAKLQM